MCVSAEVAMLSLFFTSRIVESFTLQFKNQSKLSLKALILVSVILAQKYLDDRRINNAIWARIGGFEVEVVNTVERNCLAILGYELWTEPETYMKWSNAVLKEIEEP
ncbi:hypothetical protein HK096_002935, partial [Nowakowskiella sp. JEL0078]